MESWQIMSRLCSKPSDIFPSHSEERPMSCLNFKAPSPKALPSLLSAPASAAPELHPDLFSPWGLCCSFCLECSFPKSHRLASLFPSGCYSGLRFSGKTSLAIHLKVPPSLQTSYSSPCFTFSPYHLALFISFIISPLGFSRNIPREHYQLEC